MNNLFETVKSAVSVPKAAAFYGLKADHSEMIATANARSIEEIKSFLSRQKET